MCWKLFFLSSFVLVMALVSTNVTFGEAIERSIAVDEDAVEEHGDWDGGKMESLTSDDLEMPYEDTGMGEEQIIGLRFTDIAIPKGATITAASVQFQVDEDKDGTLPVNLIIEGELAPNAAGFTSDAFSVTSRPRTTAQVQWSVPDWPYVDDRGPDQATPDIASIIQEIINQEGWAGGNALVLIFSDDPANPSTGIRCWLHRLTPDRWNSLRPTTGRSMNLLLSKQLWVRSGASSQVHPKPHLIPTRQMAPLITMGQRWSGPRDTWRPLTWYI